MTTTTNVPPPAGATGSLADQISGRALDSLVAERVFGWEEVRQAHPRADWMGYGPTTRAGLSLMPVPCYSSDAHFALAVRDWVRGKLASQRTRIAALIQQEVTRRRTPELVAIGAKVSMYAVLIQAEPEDWCRAAVRWVEEQENMD